MKRNGRFTNGCFTALAVFLVSSLAAGCVQGVHSAGERGVPVEDLLTGERLVRVRIPINAAARALTLELARDSIDFYEVVFKHSDGRTFRASATINRELSIVLPVGAYETVLLAGTYNSNTLLASAYQDSVSVDTDTTKITYELKALDASVKKAEFKYFDWDIYAAADTTPEGLPYISLDYYIWDGTITIGNFPHAAIFDPVLVKNNRQAASYNVLNDVYRAFGVSAGFRIKEYDELYREASELAAITDGLSSFDNEDGAAEYVEAAKAAVDRYDDLRFFIVDSMYDMQSDINNLLGFINTLKDSDFNGNTAAMQAWTEAYNAFHAMFPEGATNIWWSSASAIASVMNVYNAAVAAVDQDWSTAADEIEAAKTARQTFEAGFAALNLPTGVEYLAAVEKLRAAVVVTSGVRVGSFGVDDLPATTFLEVGGYIDFANDQYSSYEELIDALKQGGSITPTVKIFLFTYLAYKEGGVTAAYFDFAFKPFGSSQANTWHIKGGLNNRVIDDGSGIGGGILIKVVGPY